MPEPTNLRHVPDNMLFGRILHRVNRYNSTPEHKAETEALRVEFLRRAKGHDEAIEIADEKLAEIDFSPLDLGGEIGGNALKDVLVALGGRDREEST